MVILAGLSILIFLTYAFLLLYYNRTWKHIPVFDSLNQDPKLTISIIIPARNEEKNIERLLDALQHQNYPAHLFEVIVIDDASDDHTADLVRGYQEVTLISLSEKNINAGKKKAIDTGIKKAKNEFIVQTDADCRPGKNWLRSIASYQESNQACFIAAPVVFDNNQSLLQVFQALDFLVLQGITGVSVTKKIHAMCNGANMAYSKTTFMEVNGFENIDHIASGDDMLLMHKIAEKYPDRIYYLKSRDAIVTAWPETSWSAFFNQRIRWASKAAVYKETRIIVILALVYLFNLLFVILGIAGFFNYRYWLLCIGLLLLKWLAELPFVCKVAVFFSKRSLLNCFLLFQPLHIFYTVVAGWLGQFGKYNWKGRKVK